MLHMHTTGHHSSPVNSIRAADKEEAETDSEETVEAPALASSTKTAESLSPNDSRHLQLRSLTPAAQKTISGELSLGFGPLPATPKRGWLPEGRREQQETELGAEEEQEAYDEIAMEAVIKAGVLTKRGSSFPWSWKRRRFEYDALSRTLFYYADKVTSDGTTALGQLTVKHVVRDTTYYPTLGLLFEGECGRLLYAVAENEEQYELWLACGGLPRAEGLSTVAV